MAENLNEERRVEDYDSLLTVKNLWMLFVLNWQWFALSVVVCVASAFLYLRYKQPVYSSTMKVLIKDDNTKSRYAQNSMGLAELGIVSNTNGFDNELEILHSKNLALRTVKSLKLYVSYKRKGRVRNTILYKTSPILVDMEEACIDELPTPIDLEITAAGEGIRVKASLQSEGNLWEMEQTLSGLPGMMRTPVGTLLFRRNPGFELDESKILVRVFPPRMMGNAYAARLGVAPSSKTTTVALLTLHDTDVPRASDYLRELIESYNADANEDKNEVARKTEEFINGRLAMIQDELDVTEGELELFKKNNELINLKNDATAALASSEQFQQKQVEMQTQLALVKSLLDYVEQPQHRLEVIPANLGISDVGLNAQISRYNEQVLQRNRLLRSASESSPVVANLTAAIESQWPAIRQSILEVYKNLQVQKEGIDKQYDRYMGKIANTPSQERALNNIGRQQEIKAGLYLMLLQKREENLISQASTAVKGRIIDVPECVGKVSPRSSMVMLVGLATGVALPLGILLLLALLRYKIEGRADVERLTHLPILADIPLAPQLDKGQRAVVVRPNSNNMMEEAFRGLRTNLRFVMGQNEKVLLCTSVIPGEGKTFVSTNLAMSLALLGRKVLIVGLDIRKPRLVRLFGLSDDKRGITSFLAGDTENYALLDAQITHGVLNDNLDVLPAGICPPNPGELISKSLLDKGIEHLRSSYDYIILDTSPIGLVSDTLEMGRLADATFFVCRADHTPKSNFAMVNEVAASGKLPKVNFVLNGVDLSKKKYGYYYGLGHYGRYGRYSHYGHYGLYGSYGVNDGAVGEH